MSRKQASSSEPAARTVDRRDTPHKGRGAVTNRDGRFEVLRSEPADDGWPAWDDGLVPEALRTTVTPDRAKTVITRNTSPDISFDRSINPYRGCEHGCVYCFARPTHAYLGLSPGLDFETRLFAKQDIAETLRRELSRPRYRCAVIALGVNTDAYQPVERRLRRTRAVLEVLSAFNHPVGLITKSHAVLRDLDLLAPMAAANLASVAVSLTTLDPELARRMEPRAPSPANRLRAIRALAEAGVPVTVMAAPMIPSVNDIELERILEAARDHGATGAGYVLLRVPLEIEGLVAEWLEAHRPGQARRVFSLLRQAHEGKAYRSEFGIRMRGSGPYADMLASRFALATRKLGLNRRQWALDTTQFRVPDAATGQRQLSLF